MPGKEVRQVVQAIENGPGILIACSTIAAALDVLPQGGHTEAFGVIQEEVDFVRLQVSGHWQ